MFLPGWGLPSQTLGSGVPPNAQRHSALKKQQQARKPPEVGSSWLVWSQLLTLVTDGPLSLPVMQPKWQGGVPSGKLCSAQLRESRLLGSVAVRGGGLCVDEARAPHGLVLLLCPGSGKLTVAESGMDGHPTSMPGWAGLGADGREGKAFTSQANGQGAAVKNTWDDRGGLLSHSSVNQKRAVWLCLRPQWWLGWR